MSRERIQRERAAAAPARAARARERPSPDRISDAQLARLQRTAGNAAVGRRLQRERAAQPPRDREQLLYDFEFRVGADVPAVLARAAKKAAREGPIAQTQLRRLQRVAREHGQLGDMQRMFLAGLLDAENARALSRMTVADGASLSFSLGSIRAGMPRVKNLGRPAKPARAPARAAQRSARGPRAAAAGRRAVARAEPPRPADVAAATGDAELEAAFQAIKNELDSLMYVAEVEENVLAILGRWARKPQTGVSPPLDKLLVRLRTTVKLTGLFDTAVSYYDLMFEFDRAEELRQIRDRHSRLFVGEEPLRRPKFFGMEKDDFFGSLWEDVKTGAVERRIYAYVRGLAEAGVGLVEGMAMLLDPWQWPKIAAAIGNLPQTATILWANREKFWNDFLTAKPEEQARIIGRVVGEIEIQLASMGVGASAGKASVTVPALAEATVAMGRGGATMGRLGTTAVTISVDLGKLGKAGHSLILMSQVTEGATEGQKKADAVKPAEGEPPGPKKEPPKPPEKLREPGEGIPVKAKWGNPKSQPAYGHSQLYHGQKRAPKKFLDDAVRTKTPQGQFYDDMTIVEAERHAPLKPGAHEVDLGRPAGRVYHPDGTITENVTKVRVVRAKDLTLTTSYPIP